MKLYAGLLQTTAASMVLAVIPFSSSMVHAGQADDADGLQESNLGQAREYGDRISLGGGALRVYQTKSRDGRPIALGVEFTNSTLKGLPQEPNDGLNCWDENKDGEVDLEMECSGGHNRVLFLPANRSLFKWLSVDWEPHGHVPADYYSLPHFDFHFYMMDFVERNRIAVGECTPGTIDCKQEEIAVKEVPQQYIHADFFNTFLAFSRMGNHWADKTSPEFNGGTFANTFILGSYDGKITFYEPMLSLQYLQSQPNECRRIKQPAQFAVAGLYPTNYCVRYQSRSGTYTVSLENFVQHSAG